MILDQRDVVIDGVTVSTTVERHVVLVRGDWSEHEDRVTIRAPHLGCGDLEVTAEAGVYFLALGRQDFVTGHREFDDRYIVKTDDVDALRYWLGADEAEAVLSTYDPTALEPFALSVDRERVELTASWRVQTELTRDPLIPSVAGIRAVQRVPPWVTGGFAAAERAVAVLAGRGARLAAAWRALLAPCGLVDDGPVWCTDARYGLTLERGRSRIRVDFPWQLPPLRRNRLRTRLSMAWPDRGPAAVWNRSWSWRERPRVTRGRELALPRPWLGEALDAPALAAVPRLTAVLDELAVDWLLINDGRLALGWERIVDDRERLVAAAGHLARWAEQLATTAGPYR